MREQELHLSQMNQIAEEVAGATDGDPFCKVNTVSGVPYLNLSLFNLTGCLGVGMVNEIMYVK